MGVTKGRVTIPTDVDVVPETLELIRRWGADAIRDCDGTDYPEELKKIDAKVYATYYTTRKDNAWAKANPDEIQQCYIMTKFYTADSDTLSIHLMDGIYPEMLKVNSRDDCKRWWEVVDRTTGAVVETDQWRYEEKTGNVILSAEPFHDYTVSFLAYIMWDPVHMYNAVVNDWKDVEHQITFDVRQPKTHKYSMERRKCRWQYMLSATDGRFISAVCHIPWRIAVSCTAVFFGAATVRKTLINGFLPILMWKYMPMYRMENIVW